MEKWTMLTDFILIGGMALLAFNMVFLAKAKNNFSKRLLLFFFGSAFFFLLYYYSYLHRLRILGALAVFFGHGIGFLLGPILIFQLKSLVLSKEQILKSLRLQLIPFLMVWLFITVPLSISMATRYKGFVQWYASHDYYINIPENIFFLIYIFKAHAYLKKLRINLFNNYSSLENNDLKWYNHLLLGLAFIVVLDTFCTLYELIYPPISWNIGTLIAFCFVILYTYLGYKGMVQSQILLPDFLIENTSEKKSEDLSKSLPTKKVIGQLEHYTHEQIEQLKTNLFQILEDKKLYLDETLNLSDLAEEMRISPKKLSELLNQHMNISFYNLINQYRVNEVMKRMLLPEYNKYTLVGLAYECGFQSKATFNRIFKQKTGKSPSNFKKEYSKNALSKK